MKFWDIDDKKHNWQDEWKGMPEYINQKQAPPKITATFKFKTVEDFDKFMGVVKKQLYDDKRVFDGKQQKDKKSAWFPLPSRPSEHVYIVQNEEADENEE